MEMESTTSMPPAYSPNEPCTMSMIFITDRRFQQT